MILILKLNLYTAAISHCALLGLMERWLCLRYDVRATLSDLTQYEAPLGGYENRIDCLTPAEQKAEQLCEEERYYSLYHNEIDEEAYQGKHGNNLIFPNIEVILSVF